jgi:hypothetical protein
MTLQVDIDLAQTQEKKKLQRSQQKILTTASTSSRIFLGRNTLRNCFHVSEMNVKAETTQLFLIWFRDNSVDNF